MALGLDRLYLKSKYYLINFHITSSLMLIYTIFDYEQMIKYNILLFIIMVILLLVKLFYYFTSFYYSIKYEFEINTLDNFIEGL